MLTSSLMGVVPGINPYDVSRERHQELDISFKIPDQETNPEDIEHVLKLNVI